MVDEESEKRIDSDLRSAIAHNSQDNGFSLDDVAYVLGACFGENDGPNYYWLMSMKDHTYAVVSGGCDYTGWDCQSYADSEIFPTLKEALKSLPKVNEYDKRAIQKSIKLQLAGELAYGEVIEAR